MFKAQENLLYKKNCSCDDEEQGSLGNIKTNYIKVILMWSKLGVINLKFVAHNYILQIYESRENIEFLSP